MRLSRGARMRQRSAAISRRCSVAFARSTPAAAALVAMRAAVAEADGIIFAAPEYNYSYSALTKNTIDWITRPMGAGALRGKKVMVVSLTPGPGGGRHVTATIAEILPFLGNEERHEQARSVWMRGVLHDR